MVILYPRTSRSNMQSVLVKTLESGKRVSYLQLRTRPELGSISERFESNGNFSANDSAVASDKGGWSYGSYQHLRSVQWVTWRLFLPWQMVSRFSNCTREWW